MALLTERTEFVNTCSHKRFRAFVSKEREVGGRREGREQEKRAEEGKGGRGMREEWRGEGDYSERCPMTLWRERDVDKTKERCNRNSSWADRRSVCRMNER